MCTGAFQNMFQKLSDKRSASGLPPIPLTNPVGRVFDRLKIKQRAPGSTPTAPPTAGNPLRM